MDSKHHIFREYDIRGFAESELTDETNRSIGRAFGTFLQGRQDDQNQEEHGERGKAGSRGKEEHGEPVAGRSCRVAIGHDLRPSSERIRKGLIEGLLSTGVDVTDLGLIPTPLLYFGIVHFKLDAGISITGSHNPPEYNGFKFQLADRPFYGDDIRALAEWIENEEACEEREGKGRKSEGRSGEGREAGRGGGGEKKGEERSGRKREKGGPTGREEPRGEKNKGEEEPEEREAGAGGVEKEAAKPEEGGGNKGRLETADILTPYLKRLKDEFHFQKQWKVAVDSGHGMAGLVAPRLFKELGLEVIELYSNLDPQFPDHHPDPSVLKNLEDLSKKVRETKAPIGIAFDGDMDRIGVVDEKGEPLLGDRLLMIYARQILKKKRGASIIGDVKCSPLLYREIEKRGGRPVLWKTGHSLIKAKMKEEKAALGGEMSGHMFFADRWYGFDDALYAACRLVEILDEEKRPLSELLRDLPKVVSTPEIRVEVASDRKKFEIVRNVVSDLKRELKRGQSPGGSPRIFDLDGARIEFEDGFGLIRASNTQPVLVMRFEANSEKRLAEIRALIEGKVRKYGGLK